MNPEITTFLFIVAVSAFPSVSSVSPRSFLNHSEYINTLSPEFTPLQTNPIAFSCRGRGEDAWGQAEIQQYPVDCQDAIHSFHNNVVRTRGRRLYFFLNPGHDTASEAHTPRRYVHGRCVLAIFLRSSTKEEAIDDEILEMRPVGLRRMDVATFMDIEAAAVQVFHRCVFPAHEDGSPGWAIARRSNSIAVALWGTNSHWDTWARSGRWPPFESRIVRVG